MDQFSNPLEDPHPIRLLTVARVLTPPSTDPMTSSASAPATPAGGGGGGGANDTNGGGGAATLPTNPSPTTVEAHTLCLTVELAARDRALMVSTVERTFDFQSTDYSSGKNNAFVMNCSLLYR